jgi:hypothetical protein
MSREVLEVRVRLLIEMFQQQQQQQQQLYRFQQRKMLKLPVLVLLRRVV